MLESFLPFADEHYVTKTPVTELWKHFDLVRYLTSDSSSFNQVQQSIEKERGLASIDSDSLSDDIVSVSGGIFSMDGWNEAAADEGIMRLIVVLPSPFSHESFARTVRHLGRNGVDIVRATLNRIEYDSDQAHDYLILTFYVRCPFAANSTAARDLIHSINQLPFLDDSVLRWIEVRKESSVVDAELVIAWARLAHCLLAEEKPLVFTHYHIRDFLNQHPTLVRALLDFWKFKYVFICRLFLIPKDLRQPKSRRWNRARQSLIPSSSACGTLWKQKSSRTIASISFQSFSTLLIDHSNRIINSRSACRL
jgi:hypothetical protein